ncbi:hypothetical protein TYRP_005769 [Tyrophagus putrescentiae]|nr:hypothetical protein TYRP_005769 [Tyrophagus putrescentiae]
MEPLMSPLKTCTGPSAPSWRAIMQMAVAPRLSGQSVSMRYSPSGAHLLDEPLDVGSREAAEGVDAAQKKEGQN